jgi:hypothetical protein
LQPSILVRDVRDAGPRRVVGTLAHALRDPIEDKLPLGQGAGAGHPGQPRTHRAAGLGADRHPTLVSHGLRRAARVRVGLLAALQSLSNLAANAITGFLWTLVSARRPSATSPGWLWRWSGWLPPAAAPRSKGPPAAHILRRARSHRRTPEPDQASPPSAPTAIAPESPCVSAHTWVEAVSSRSTICLLGGLSR